MASTDGNSRPRVKICCIKTVAEAQLAVRYGASALGLVSAMPSGPGIISESLITEISAVIPPGVSRFLLTSETNVDRIVAQQRRCRTDTVQLCDAVPTATLQTLKQTLPGIRFVQVIHVRDEDSVNEALLAAVHADALLLDSGNPFLAVKELGGTGRTHNWALSRRIVEGAKIPVYLAGGLRPENLAEAVALVKPFGLDLCTSVRTDDSLDETKLAAFFRAVAAL